MRADEIERFFAARVVGHGRAGDGRPRTADRAPGRAPARSASSTATTARRCTTSRSARRTPGARATAPRRRGSCSTTRSARSGCIASALFVFEFNERAIRAYERCGFVVEGRSRESIWRDGRWWDEMAMSVLESDWRARRDGADDAARAAPTSRARRPGDDDELEADRRIAADGLLRRPSAMSTQRARRRDAARAEVRELIAAKGHAVDNARAASRGSTRRSRPATSSGRRRWTCSSAT